ncbi:hypothetical protein TRFO_26278 [Tritrichomonas foetus]|uniref:Protein kinase domain-containing protein n=1 Tax=Tritrichomonas foetus TaxID=1144522 RepID=A0A1J4K821_9EUKA|nr:hypothetical protein TRFO_26278 [Tritrichomonas foetus]|eukprot:OHT05852.1 hypothetical protein TRFO_26278 [Tritrichomonas foetus]
MRGIQKVNHFLSTRLFFHFSMFLFFHKMHFCTLFPHNLFSTSRMKKNNILPTLDLNDFEQIESLGNKGYGKVTKLSKKSNNELYVSKSLFIESDNKSRIKYNSFLTNISSLSHPCLPRIFTTNDSSTLLTEFYPKTLESVITNEYDKITFSLQIKLLFGIASALNCLHQNNITHGDLKPTNVYIASVNKYNNLNSNHAQSNSLNQNNHVSISPHSKNDGNIINHANDALKIITNTDNNSDSSVNNYLPIVDDFGFHQFYDLSHSKNNIPAFRAPELSSHDKQIIKITKEADVFSFGMLAYYVFVRKYPKGHQALSLKDGLRPEMPKTGDSAIPRSIRKLICSCWAQDPSVRPDIPHVLSVLADCKLDDEGLSEFMLEIEPKTYVFAMISNARKDSLRARAAVNEKVLMLGKEIETLKKQNELLSTQISSLLEQNKINNHQINNQQAKNQSMNNQQTNNPQMNENINQGDDEWSEDAKRLHFVSLDEKFKEIPVSCADFEIAKKEIEALQMEVDVLKRNQNRSAQRSPNQSPMQSPLRPSKLVISSSQQQEFSFEELCEEVRSLKKRIEALETITQDRKNNLSLLGETNLQIARIQLMQVESALKQMGAPLEPPEEIEEIIEEYELIETEDE